MEKLSPDLASKVLLADLRNLITKVKEGGNLPPWARELFQKAALSSTLSGEKRIAALLTRWEAGERLDGGELAELHAWTVPADPDLLPPPASVETEKSDIPSGPPVPHPAAAFTLETEGPRIAGSRVSYPNTYAEYAVLFDNSERTIKRWVNVGRYQDPETREKPRVPLDLPPLHRPQDMPDWWKRRMENACPAGVLLAAEKARVSNIAPPSPTQEKSQPVLSTPPHPDPPLLFDSVATLDFPAHVEALRREYAIVKGNLESARQGEVVEGRRVIDSGLVESLQRQALALSQEVRKAENDLTAWLKEREELVMKKEVRADMARIMSTVFTSVLRLVSNVRPQLVGKAKNEEDAIWDSAVRRAFAVLKTSRFTEPIPDESHA